MIKKSDKQLFVWYGVGLLLMVLPGVEARETPFGMDEDGDKTTITMGVMRPVYLVSIWGTDDNPLCQGTYLGSGWVLTARHCGDYTKAAYITFKGMVSSKHYKVLRPCAYNASFDHSSFCDDYMLVRIRMPGGFELNDLDDVIEWCDEDSFRSAIIWGGSNPKVFRVESLNSAHCCRRFISVGSKLACVSSSPDASQGSETCVQKGHSGWPVMESTIFGCRQVGLISDGPPACEASSGAFAVSYFRDEIYDWLKSVLEATNYSDAKCAKAYRQGEFDFLDQIPISVPVNASPYCLSQGD